MKEIFDRFKLDFYKEKEMADFRRWFTVLAVLALMAGAASAQIGQTSGSSSSALQCTANAAGTPQVRQEGYTELLGDILITCTGGSPMTVGSKVDTTNITIYTSPALNITSRVLGSSTAGVGVSEALLLIDEPGSNLPSGVAGAYGPKAPQVLCPYSSTANGCATYVGTDPGVVNGPYTVAVNAADSSVAAANVYQGIVGALGNNTVTFYGVPVMPPASNGVSRSFRITNVRVPTVGMSNQQTISVFISTNPHTVLPIQQANLAVGVVGTPMKAAVTMSSANPFAQCKAPGITLSATLSFTEGFATMFKTRVVPMTNTLYASTGQNLTTQNIPGGLYNSFASNSESGFIMATAKSSAYTAGLADFGTRLKAVFTNIPAGLSVYVSTGSLPITGLTAPSPIGGTSTTPYGVLVSGSISDAGTYGTVIPPIAATSTSVGAAAADVVQLVANSSTGQMFAVWEVVNSNPGANDTISFGVYVNYTPASASATNPYGLPAITSQFGVLTSPFTNVNNVSLSFAPEPLGGSFTTTSGPTFLAGPLPRFAIVNTYQGPWVSIILCQTTLLYPFVTSNPGGGLGQGFDTGIAIANTSKDPFTALGIPTNPSSGTLATTGSCTLYGYGFSVTTTGTTSTAAPVVKGCDMIANAQAGVNCFPVVNPGEVQTVLASQVLSAQPNGFQGYVIAVCNFQYAHGYAAVTDLGLRGLFSSYLALELTPNTALGNGRGVGIEQLVH